MATKNKSLGDVLVERGVISQEQLRQAREVQKSAPGDLGLIIQDLGFASERDVTAARAQELGLQFADIARYPVDPAAVKSVPEHVVKRYNILPIKRDGNRLMVAIGDPKSSIQGLDDVRLVSRCQITPVLAPRTDLEAAIVRAYNAAAQNGAGPTPASRPSSGGSNGPSSVPALIKDDDMTPAVLDGVADGVAGSGDKAPDKYGGAGSGGAVVPSGKTGSGGSDLASVLAVDLAGMQGGDRGGRRQPEGDLGGGADHPHRPRHRPAGDPREGLRHPHRAGPARRPHPLPHRRRPERDHDRAQAHHEPAHLALQDHGRPEHRRAARPPGRTHPDPSRGQGL